MGSKHLPEFVSRSHLVTVYDLGGVEVPKSPHEERVFRKARFGAFEHPGHNKHRLDRSHPPVVVVLDKRYVQEDG